MLRKKREGMHSERSRYNFVSFEGYFDLLRWKKNRNQIGGRLNVLSEHSQWPRDICGRVAMKTTDCLSCHKTDGT